MSTMYCTGTLIIKDQVLLNLHTLTQDQA